MNVFSQELKVETLVRKANQLFEKNKYNDAVPLYLDIETKKHSGLIEDTDLFYRIAYCYYSSEQEKEKSIPYFLKFFGVSKTVYEPHYFLGRVYQLANRNDEALEQYALFKKLVEADKSTKKETRTAVLKLLNKEIDCCNYSKFLLANPIKAFVQNLGDSLNTPYSEYAPVIDSHENKLVFTRRCPENIGGKISPDGDYFEDVYLCNILEGGLKQNFDFDKSAKNNYQNISNFKFSTPSKFDGNINGPGHDAGVAFSYDSKKLFIYKNLQVWASNLDSAIWQPAHKVEEISFPDKSYYEPSISISMDENEIYISCEKAGGYGGLDLYKSIKINGVWSTPENLGPRINTSEDEDAPYIDPNGKRLYFSSKGHSSMGGYDIFKSDFDGKNWSSPTNLGYPVNSSGDDIFFIMPSKYNRGYYSSNKPGGHGKMDLYRVTFANERPPFAEIQGIVLQGNNFIPGKATLSLLDTTAEKQISNYVSDASGNYLLMVMHGIKNLLNIDVPHFSPLSTEFSISQNVDCYQLYQEIHATYIYAQLGNIVGQKISLFTTENRGRLLDSINKYNGKLGEKATNDFKNTDVHDSTYKNIIVDVKFYYSQDSISKLVKKEPSILHNIDSNADVYYACKGKFIPGIDMTLPEEYMKGSLIKAVPENNFFVLTAKDNAKELEDLFKSSGNNLSSEVPRIVVLFDYGKGVLPKDCIKTLEILVAFMKKNKNFYFEVSGHTDSKGTNEQNKKLSLTRAEAVKNYMIKKGISAERLTTIGKGEEFPNAPNEHPDGSDNPKGRKENRRIELKVLKQ